MEDTKTMNEASDSNGVDRAHIVSTIKYSKEGLQSVQNKIDEMELTIASSTSSDMGREKDILDLDGLKESRDELSSSVDELEDLLKKIDAR